MKRNFELIKKMLQAAEDSDDGSADFDDSDATTTLEVTFDELWHHGNLIFFRDAKFHRPR